MTLPRSVGPARVFAWLRAGWRDFLAVPGASAVLGLERELKDEVGVEAWGIGEAGPGGPASERIGAAPVGR